MFWFVPDARVAANLYATASRSTAAVPLLAVTWLLLVMVQAVPAVRVALRTKKVTWALVELESSFGAVKVLVPHPCVVGAFPVTRVKKGR